MFDKIEWKEEGVASINGVTLKLHDWRVPWDRTSDFLPLLKPIEFINQYATLFSRYPEFKPKKIFELGMYGGGSTALWFELFEPDFLVAIDQSNAGDTPYFEQCMRGRGVKTYWLTDQADSAKLKGIVATDLGGSLDLVFDDASHLYAPTKASFEALFPLLSPGGFYIIEDWAWNYWDEYNEPGAKWWQETAVAELVIQLVEAQGSSRSRPRAMTQVELYPGLAVVQRGPRELPSDFRLESLITRRDKPYSVFPAGPSGTAD